MSELKALDKSDWDDTDLKWYAWWKQQLADTLNSIIPNEFKTNEALINVIQNAHYIGFISGVQYGTTAATAIAMDGYPKYDIRQAFIR